MIYGYLRVSTDNQTVENQRFEINNYCKRNKIKINKWIEETISSRRKLDDRKLGTLIKEVQKGDVIIASELSRLGRNLMEVMGMLNYLLEINAVVKTIKDNYTLGNDIQSKVLAFAFGISAEIERQLISQRTKEALHRAISEGVYIGRPKGSLNKHTKLKGHLTEIKTMLRQGVSKVDISKYFGCYRTTLRRFLISNKCKEKYIWRKNQYG